MVRQKHAQAKKPNDRRLRTATRNYAELNGGTKKPQDQWRQEGEKKAAKKRRAEVLGVLVEVVVEMHGGMRQPDPKLTAKRKG